MSHVTSIIVTCGVGDKGIGGIHHYLESIGKSYLQEVKKFHGGGKAMQADVWIGAYDWISINDFVMALSECEWECPEGMALFVLDEHDECFKPVWVSGCGQAYEDD